MGANIGEYTQMILEVFKEKPHLICAFEPSIISFKMLESNIQSHLVKKYNLGLGSKEANLWLRNSGSKVASVVEEKGALDTQDLELIHLSTLDNFCEQHSIAEIDLLKMDVEGFEYDVLEGSKRLLSEGRIGFIQFEFGYASVLMKSGKYFRDYFDLLQADFNIYRIVKDGLIPIPAATFIDEIYYGANFLACNKKAAIEYGGRPDL